MRNLLPLVWFTASLVLSAWGQSAKVDSLRRVIETTQVDTVRVRALCQLGEELQINLKYAEALESGHQGLRLAQKTTDRRGEVKCLSQIGNVYYTQSDYTCALDAYRNSLKVYEEVR